METARPTVLFDLHKRLGARMTEFAGFAMPVSYTGIIEEHLVVRACAGLFDLSHMGELEVSGPNALGLLEHALTNSAARLAQGRAHYSLICTSSGGVIDDVLVYRLDAERYMLCVNAANVAADREWLADLNRTAGARLSDLSEETALVAIQGPRALDILGSLAAADLHGLARFAVAPATIAGVPCLAARTGYTGEDGCELFVAAARAAGLFEALLEAGRPLGMLPCGLGARDTLRMEAGLPLYGHELDRETSPLEAGLGAFVKLGRDFVGAKALAAQKAAGSRKRLVGIRTDDARSIARQGYRVLCGGREAGAVTSGSFAPSFNRPLAIAYLPTEALLRMSAQDGLEVEIRSRRVAVTQAPLPFYRRATAQQQGARLA